MAAIQSHFTLVIEDSNTTKWGIPGPFTGDSDGIPATYLMEKLFGKDSVLYYSPFNIKGSNAFMKGHCNLCYFDHENQPDCSSVKRLFYLAPLMDETDGSIIEKVVGLISDSSVEVVVQGGTVGEDGVVHPEEGYNVKFSHPAIQAAFKARSDVKVFTTPETKKYFTFDQLTEVCGCGEVAEVCIDTKFEMLLVPPIDRPPLTKVLYLNGTNIKALLELAGFSSSDDTATHVKSAMWLTKSADPAAAFEAALQLESVKEILASPELELIRSSGVDPEGRLLMNLAFVSEFKKSLSGQPKDAAFYEKMVPYSPMYDAVAVMAHFFNFKLSPKPGPLDTELWDIYKHHVSEFPPAKRVKGESASE
jgi:hypothetical protein